MKNLNLTVLNSALLSLLLATAASASDAITCSLERASGYGKSDDASVSLQEVVLKSEVTASSAGINVGKLNYSFDMTVTGSAPSYSIDVIFYENNRAEDEVGSFSCQYDSTRAESVICTEPVSDDYGREILKFSCKAI